jgi:hypothetical protein
VRIHRLLLATVAAVLCFAVAAVAQTTQFDIRGSASVTGGTKKKPKPGVLKFGFTVTDPSGLQPAPLQTYDIAIEGGRMNFHIMKYCSAAKINAAGGDDSVCPKGSKIGSGALKAKVGTAGAPLGEGLDCAATLTLYAAGKKAAALFVKSTIATCPAAVNQAIPMTYYTRGDFNGLKFTVPNELRHQIGLDITVVDVDTTFPKVVKTIKKGKKKVKVGFVESTGCKDATREIEVTFTDEKGVAFPVKDSMGKC